MKELTLAVIAYIFALLYNLILFILNMKCADDEFVNIATLLMTVNSIKDAIILWIILYNIFLR